MYIDADLNIPSQNFPEQEPEDPWPIRQRREDRQDTKKS
jgi:hypothetical protein